MECITLKKQYLINYSCLKDRHLLCLYTTFGLDKNQCKVTLREPQGDKLCLIMMRACPEYSRWAHEA